MTDDPRHPRPRPGQPAGRRYGPGPLPESLQGRTPDAFKPPMRRQRLRVLGYTLATVVVLWVLLLFRPGAHVRHFPSSPPKPCASGQTSDCVGGKASVLLLPPSTASATAR